MEISRQNNWISNEKRLGKIRWMRRCTRVIMNPLKFHCSWPATRIQKAGKYLYMDKFSQLFRGSLEHGQQQQCDILVIVNHYYYYNHYYCRYLQHRGHWWLLQYRFGRVMKKPCDWVRQNDHAFTIYNSWCKDLK